MAAIESVIFLSLIITLHANGALSAVVEKKALSERSRKESSAKVNYDPSQKLLA